MSKSQRTKTTAMAQQSWEDERRQETAIALERANAALKEIEALYTAQREAQDRDLAKAREVHAALQAWVDGAEFPKVAHTFGRLYAQTEHFGRSPHESDAARRREESVMDALDRIAGCDDLSAYDGLDPDGHGSEPIEALMRDPLRVACGFVLDAGESEDTETAEKAA